MHLKDLTHNVYEFTQCFCCLSFTRRSAELKINAVSGSSSRSKACPSEWHDRKTHRRNCCCKWLPSQRSRGWSYIVGHWISWRKPWAIPMFFRSNESPPPTTSEVHKQLQHNSSPTSREKSSETAAGCHANVLMEMSTNPKSNGPNTDTFKTSGTTTQNWEVSTHQSWWNSSPRSPGSTMLRRLA